MSSISLQTFAEFYVVESSVMSSFRTQVLVISIHVRRNSWRSKKINRTFDHALQCKTIIQDLIFFPVDHCRFIFHCEHNVIRDNVNSAPYFIVGKRLEYTVTFISRYTLYCEMKLKIYSICSF